jgi:phage shock protein E
MNFIIKHKLTIAGIALGAIGGYLYYYFIGCASGSCAITSNPINSTLYGAMMGGLFLNMFQKEKSKSN